MTGQPAVIKLASKGPNQIQFLFHQIISATDAQTYYATAQNRSGRSRHIKAHGILGEALVVGNLNVFGIHFVEIMIYALNVTKSAAFTWEETLPGIVSTYQRVLQPRSVIIAPLEEQPGNDVLKLLRILYPTYGLSPSVSTPEVTGEPDPAHQKFDRDWDALLSGQKIKYA